MSTDMISIAVVDGEPRVDSRLIAGQLGVEHQNTRELIQQYQADFEEFGILRFETGEIKGRGQPKKFVLLNEDQSYLLLTYTQNTPQARDLKKRLIRSFGEHRRNTVLPRFRPEKTRKALPGGLTIEQQDAVKALVKSRIEILPHGGQAKAAITCWSAIKSKFGVSYKEVPAANFPDVLSLVARLPLETDSKPPFLQGEFGARFLIQLEGGGRYSVTPIAVTEIVVDLADLIAIDDAMDTWRNFAKRKELNYYRAGAAKQAGPHA